MTLVFFMIGLTYVGLTGVAKGQGLAGGAIAIFYGGIFAVTALILSIYLSVVLSKSKIIFSNRFLLIILMGYLVFVSYRILTRNSDRNTTQRIEIPLRTVSHIRDNKEDTGIGMVRLKYSEQSTFYFYGNPNFNKAIDEHAPFDSLVLEMGERGLRINYAPPWLMPEHMRLDYDILFFKALSISDDFIEIEVNQNQSRSAFLDKRHILFTTWAQFLLQVHSVEPINPQDQLIRIKPLDHASLISAEYAFLKPVQVRDQWMKVEMISDAYESLGSGWIRWKENGEMLIRYYLLS